MTDQRAGGHVTDDGWIDTVIAAIPPKEWKVTVWEQPTGNPMTGTVDGFDKRRLVQVIVRAYADEILGPPVTMAELREAVERGPDAR